MPDPYSLALGQMARRQAETERRLREDEVRESGYSMGDVIGTALGFPSLRGFWPFSSVDENNLVLDLSGQARALTNAGGVSFDVENQIVPYATLDGIDDHFWRGDEAGLDITGALTLLCWFRLGALGAVQPLVTKDEVSSGRSYTLYVDSLNRLVTTVFSTTNYDAAHTTTLVADQWYFGAGVFTPSASLKTFLGSLAVTQPTVPASIDNGAASFKLGRDNTRYLTGDITLSAVCAAALPDALITRFYNISRTLFGV